MAIITVKDVDYRFIIYDINKSEVINLLGNSMLEDRGYIKKMLSDLWLGVVNLKNTKGLKKDKWNVNACSMAS